jgi:hypothetical protein
MLIVAVRTLVAVFSAMLTANVPSPLPEVGDTVHHVAPELTATAHATLLVTAMV